MRTNWLWIIPVTGLALGVTAGCKGPSATADASPPVALTPAPPKVNFGTDVGIPLDTQTPNPAQLNNLYLSMNVRTRQDPFSLSPQERAFDSEQQTERLVQQDGMMETMYVPPPPPNDTPAAEEPQPYRRVSGILVGDSVLAIIEMGEGSPVIVRPGEYVPNTPWFVVSIDEEKVVLRRAGNILPKEISVRLEQRAPGAGGNVGPGATGPGVNGPGFNGNGPPGTGPRMGGGVGAGGGNAGGVG
ncbi:MAG: hypothetical protein ACYC96_07780 [Fimbriimonadaceae bacterium]